jgi:hypothetical protein
MWEVILHLLKQYQGFGFIGLFAMVMLAICGLIMYDSGRFMVRKYIMRKWKGRLPHPVDHRVFKSIELMIEARIPAMRIFCPLRKKIFAKLLRILLLNLKASLEKIAKEDVNRMTNEEFRNYWENVLIKIFASAEIEMKEGGLPMLAIRKFREQNAVVEDILMRHMFMTCSSETIYDNNMEKSSVILTGVELAIEAIMQAVERAIDTINGELSSVTFEGMSCQECREGCPLRSKKSHRAMGSGGIANGEI